MGYRFSAFGHPNIRAAHKTTLEFTKESELSLEGDCIIGVKANFDTGKLREFVKVSDGKRIRMVIRVQAGKKMLEEAIEARPNTLFNDNHELVVRKTDFRSGRTLGMHADKAASELDRGMAELMRNSGQKIEVVLETL